MMTSLPFGKTIAAATFAALTLGASLTMTAGTAEARDGRKGALIAAGVAGVLAFGALAAAASEHQRASGYIEDSYEPQESYGYPAYRQPVQYHHGYHPGHRPDYGYRPHRPRYPGYSETAYSYRGPVCKLKKQQVWDGYGWRIQRVQICR
jgi:hypothetical protein